MEATNKEGQGLPLSSTASMEVLALAQVALGQALSLQIKMIVEIVSSIYYYRHFNIT
jgi:hypothetical protein